MQFSVIATRIVGPMLEAFDAYYKLLVYITQDEVLANRKVLIATKIKGPILKAIDTCYKLLVYIPIFLCIFVYADLNYFCCIVFVLLLFR